MPARTRRFDLCLTDMRLPDGNGIDLVAASRAVPQLPVAMITAHGNMESAVAAMKAGAFDFVSKPLDLQVLRAPWSRSAPGDPWKRSRARRWRAWACSGTSGRCGRSAA